MSKDCGNSCALAILSPLAFLEPCPPQFEGKAAAALHLNFSSSRAALERLAALIVCGDALTTRTAPSKLRAVVHGQTNLVEPTEEKFKRRDLDAACQAHPRQVQ